MYWKQTILQIIQAQIKKHQFSQGITLYNFLLIGYLLHENKRGAFFYLCKKSWSSLCSAFFNVNSV